MCSWGMSTLLWPGRSGVFSRDYVSYGARTSSSSRRHSSSYNRPAPLAYSAGASPGSGAYYGSRYRSSSSPSRPAPGDPWTPSPRTASFVQSQRQSRRANDGQYGQRGSRRSQHDSASSYRAAADAFRHSSSRGGGGANFDFDPVTSTESPSRQRRVRFADNVECHYPSGGRSGSRDDPASAYRQDEGRNRCRRGGQEGDKDDYRWSGSGNGDYRGYTRHGQQADHDSTYYDAYERSPRAAIQRRNSSRLDDTGVEDTRRRASKHDRKGNSRGVQVEVLYS